MCAAERQAADTRKEELKRRLQEEGLLEEEQDSNFEVSLCSGWSSSFFLPVVLWVTAVPAQCWLGVRLVLGAGRCVCGEVQST